MMSHLPQVQLNVATPEEVKAGGAGWTIVAGFADSPFGSCFVAEAPRGICQLSFGGGMNRLNNDWPNAELVRDDGWAKKLAHGIFTEERKDPFPEPLQLFVKGTEFQIRVWSALLQIPEGRLESYGRLAKRIGNPKAMRAVGTAAGCNPIAVLIPCHRIIRENGDPGGYRWGADRKRSIQQWESGGAETGQ